jgi:TolB-like protein/class 3 adenylate cyclase/Tfp pilus assembly protein PilF
MSDSFNTENDFLIKITQLIEENLSNEQFGVSELAQAIGMSRSNLLRKVKRVTGLSVSQFINQERLQHAMNLLQQKDITVSEVSYQVGFNSISYFIKCFREHYGYPPGEVGKREEVEVFAMRKEEVQSHQLAAIMFTDMQGFTALMQQDEQKALEFRDRHRKVFEEVTKKFRGRILQYYGDGTLSTFKSAIDAVKCGIELQLAFRLAPQIPVRVGIHSGDILFNKDGIIGDGVNVASRIESLAAAGSVFISEKVYDEVKNQAGIQTLSMGTFELKNVDKPIEVYAITNPGLLVPKQDQITGKLVKNLPVIKRKNWAKQRKIGITGMVLSAILLLAGYVIKKTGLWGGNTKSGIVFNQTTSEKSIAVLPFINDSSDSTNVYIINGLMESILNNLQKIEDLRVVSRTSVEQYRNTTQSLPDIARELNVRYLIEGSGQKIDDQIQLNIQLIDAPDDAHLWAQQYNREVTNIFSLQSEISKKIAEEIEVIITPSVDAQISKTPTDNLQAFDTYLQARESFNQGTGAGLTAAIPLYKKAIEMDPEFARAHAGLAITYFFLDFNQSEKQFTTLINNHADKALLYDPELETSLIAKAAYYLQVRDYASALPNLEKALEYNPNSVLVLNILSDYYTRFEPNTEKYLTYALRAIRLDIGAQDKTTASITYLHVANAFIQTGFADEAKHYINLAIASDASNIYAAYVKAYIQYALQRDLGQLSYALKEVLQLDTTRLDVLQEVGKVSYFMRDYQVAYKYYKRFVDTRNALDLDMYRVEDIKIANVMRRIGQEEEAAALIRDFEHYVRIEESIYKPMNEAMLAIYNGDHDLALEKLKTFSETSDNFHYWTILLFPKDPLMEEIKKQPEFKKFMEDLQKKFWDRHEEIKMSLQERGLI